MNAGIIAGQMLVLFFMMLAGFIAFKAHIVSQAALKACPPLSLISLTHVSSYPEY